MSIISDLRSYLFTEHGSQEGKDKSDKDDDHDDLNARISTPHPSPEPPKSPEPKRLKRIEPSEADKIGHKEFLATIRAIGKRLQVGNK